MARFLVFFVLAVLVTALAWPQLTRLGLGRLPGDIVIGSGRLRIHLPLMTSLIVAVVLSLAFGALNLLGH